jgi:cytochrome P450
VSKPEEFYSAFRVNRHARNVFNTADKEEHRRKRRIMSKAFSAKALPNYAPFICSKVEELGIKLNGGQSLGALGRWRTFNMADEFNYLMLDIMGGLCFGEAFGFISGKGLETMANVHQRAVRIYMVMSPATHSGMRSDYPADGTRALVEATATRSASLPASLQSHQRAG